MSELHKMITIPTQAIEDLGKAGLGSIFQGILNATDCLIDCEQAELRAKRLLVVGAAKSSVDVARAQEARWNAAAIRILTEASKRATKIAPDALSTINSTIKTREFAGRLTEMTAEFQDLVVEMRISGEVAAGIHGLWMEAVKVLKDKGFEALVARANSRLQEVIDARQSVNHGREAHAKAARIPKWKYAMIAACLIVAVAAVVACFVWGACAWIVLFLKALGTATASYLVYLIQQGCEPILASSIASKT